MYKSAGAADTIGGNIVLNRYLVSGSWRGGAIFNYYPTAAGQDVLAFAVSQDTTPVDLGKVKMVIGANGNVGIGTTAPVANLHTVYPYSKTDTTERFVGEWSSNDASNRWGLKVSSIGAAAQANRNFILQTHEAGVSNSGNLILQGYGGNVGIGTTGPTAKLFVRETTATTNAGITAGVVSAYSTGDMAQGFGAGLRFNIADSGASNEIAGIYGVRSNADNKGDLALVTNYLGTWYRRMRIGSEGFVFMRDGDTGTYSPASNYYLEVEKDTAGSGAIIGLSSAGTAIRGVTTSGYGIDAATNGAGYALRADGMNAGYAAVFVNGNVGIQVSAPTQKLDVAGNIKTSGCLYYNGGTLGTCASDVYLKTNINLLSFDNALEKVINLQPKTFQFADNPGRQYSGLIAQDVEQVAPELVVVDTDGHKQVKYGDIQWLTIEAVKELKAENDALKQRIEMLEKQVKI